jgi:hypothetical protein
LSNPRYQSFLHRRACGKTLDEPWCRNCPRTF